jgi:Alpha-amylase/4-alpha-glucanotransferase, C-terminal
MKPTGNGHQHNALRTPPEPHFQEDDEGVTIDSGAAVCRFNAHKGGRLERWQWRPSAEIGMQSAESYPLTPPHTPHSALRTPHLLDLVDPVHGALVDHFLPLGTRPEEIVAGTHREFGDFVEGAFRKQVVDTGGEIRIGFLRDGEIRAGKRVAEVRMAKSPAVRPGAADIAVLYRIINSSLKPLQILFAVEFNLYAPGLDKPSPAVSEGYYLVDGTRPEGSDEDPRLGSLGVSPNATHVALVNPVGEMALQLGWDRECDLWRMPPPEAGTGVRLFAVWRIQLPPRDNWAMGLWLAPG